MSKLCCWPLALVCLAAFIPTIALAQQDRPKATVGLYYFDGWSSRDHVTKLLATEFADRKPVWGWNDDTIEIMQKQIDYCADHGIAFWAFDWYYPEGKSKTTPLNNALDLYLKAPNCRRLQFCLMVANHGGFRIGPNDWNACCEKWIKLFRQPTHLRLDGQPLLIIFSPGELQKAFGGVEEVCKALDSLRAKAKKAGLPGVAVAACTGPDGHLSDLARSGYTVLTGYNYNLGWHNGGRGRPFRKLIEGNERIFNQFAQRDSSPLRPCHHSRMGLSAMGKGQVAAQQDVSLVSRPHAQAGRGVCAARRPVARQAPGQSHAPAAPTDLCLE